MSTPETVLSARYLERGNPEEVITTEFVAISPPQKGEVRLRMLYAPINPSDINTLEGTYGELRPLPDIPGNEAIGMVESVGPETEGFSVGNYVLVNSFGWREAGVWKTKDLVPLPDVLDPVQGAMLRVNAATAYCMLREFHAFQPGEWVAQNAANSGVGRWVIALARRWSISAIHLVRRAEAMEQLIAEGAQHVLLDEDDAVDAAKKIKGKASVPLALNAVGGNSAGRLAKMLTPSGTLVTYGAMSKQQLRVSNGALIFKDLRFRGYWMNRSIQKMPFAECVAMYRELTELCNQGVVKIPVAEIFPLSKVREAVRAAMGSGRPGKVLLKLGTA